jgi:hypothetical protein
MWTQAGDRVRRMFIRARCPGPDFPDLAMYYQAELSTADMALGRIRRIVPIFPSYPRLRLTVGSRRRDQRNHVDVRLLPWGHHRILRENLLARKSRKLCLASRHPPRVALIFKIMKRSHYALIFSKTVPFRGLRDALLQVGSVG